MDKEIELTFLENLFERIERDPVTLKFKLDGVISEKEYRAILFAIESLGGSCESQQDVEKEVLSYPEPRADTVIDAVPLNLDSLSLEEPEQQEVLLCLDFGTAMSKAFATDGGDENLVDLEIGRQAGQSEHVYTLMSSIFISDSGHILFGHRAVSESTHADSSNRKRMDSIKDILCKDVVCDLDQAPIDGSYNPTHVPFTKGDMVTLFLGYFTDMAVSQLHDKNYSRYVRRRFTRPVLPPDRGPWAEDQLRILLARSQILADTMHGEWDSGVDVEKAKQILNDIKNLEEIPTFLIDDGVVEPVAAVGSRFRNLRCKDDLRRLLMVVDVGAGTIDYALFAELHEKGKPIVVWEIPGSIQVLRQAGDTVDKLLRRYILKTADVGTTDSDFHMIDADLSLRIRQYKEQLFREKRVEFYLTNDSSGVVLLEEFLQQPNVREFEKAIHEKFLLCLSSVHNSWVESLGMGGLAVVLTGGGAGLPMVRSLSKNNVSTHGMQLQLLASTLIPKWVEDEYPELEDEFPQLAVAIGGSSRSLPVLAPQLFSEFRGLDVDSWEILPAYKGV